MILVAIAAFWTGAAILALEILGTRLVAPLFGATIYVWSSLITVTLAALAAGYAIGGVLADLSPLSARSADADRTRWLRLSALLAVAGGWLMLVPALRLPVLGACQRLGVRSGSLAGAAALLAVPLACLGAVGPLLARLCAADPGRMGRAMGSVSAISTVGSVAGALAAGFWLIPSFRLGGLLSSLAASLLALSALVFLLRARARTQALAAGVLALAASLAGLRAAPASESLRMRSTSLYGDVLVVDHPAWDRRVLYIDGLANTVVTLGGLRNTADYIQSFVLARFLRPGARRALLVGLGGGALPGLLAPYGIATDVVDVDPAVERAAREYFGHHATGEFHLEDGRAFFSRPGPAYDLIYLDAFNGDSQPFHLFARESFEAASRRLSPEGVLVVNLIGYARGPRAGLKRAVSRTVRSVFPNVRILSSNTTLDFDTSFVNMTLLASRGPLEFRADPAKDPAISAYAAAVKGNWIDDDDGPGAVVTDDRNPVDYLNADAMLAIRRRDLASNLALLSL